MSKLINQPLPDRVKQWITQTTIPQSQLLISDQLHGGNSAIVHCIKLQENQAVKEYVIRQFDNKEWLEEEPDLAVHEANSLLLAYEAGLPAPQLISYDENGEECGVPAVVMSKLEGKVVLEPEDRMLWVDGMAEALVDIHAIDATDFPWSYSPYKEAATLEVPEWSSQPLLWQGAIAIVQGDRPHTRSCFIHRDYHPTNLLWESGKVSGIVDWVNACRGPAGVDVGHCRVNLAQLYDAETADAFLRAYEAHAGEAFHYEPYWDLVSLADILYGPPTVYSGWTALGFTGLTDELVRERLDLYLASIMKRI